MGKVWRDKSRGDYTRYRCYSFGVEYKSGDAVYIESQRPEQPYYICCIQVGLYTSDRLYRLYDGSDCGAVDRSKLKVG